MSQPVTSGDLFRAVQILVVVIGACTLSVIYELRKMLAELRRSRTQEGGK